MPPSELLTKLALVAVQGVVLFLLSRGLFAWALEALASRRNVRGGGWLVRVVRLPGNLVHEISHAVGFLISGYRVRRIIPCIFDKNGTGACQPGEKWLPIALPWLAAGIAALAPLLVGALVLYGVARFLNIPLNHAPVAAEAPARSLLRALYDGLVSLDYGAPTTWLFLYLAFSIGAELAPSSTDVVLGIPALLALGALTAAVVLGVYQLPAEAPLRELVVREAGRGLAWLSRIFGFAIITTGAAAVITFLPASLLRAIRG